MNHNYPKIKNEIPKQATYFVSFWWAILWKEAAAVAVAAALWSWASGWSEALWWRSGLSAFIACLFYFFLRELFYATLEKRYLRKNFTMIGVDKNGAFSVQKLYQARALLWSFVWGHVALIGWAVALCAITALVLWIKLGVPFIALFFATVRSLTEPLALLFWSLLFTIYPHYRLWTRPFFGLAGFRLAVVEK